MNSVGCTITNGSEKKEELLLKLLCKYLWGVRINRLPTFVVAFRIMNQLQGMFLLLLWQLGAAGLNFVYLKDTNVATITYTYYASSNALQFIS